MVALAGLVLRPGSGRAQPAEETASPPPEGDPAALGRAQIAPPTRATFLSNSARQWDVTVDGRPVCATPCTYPLFPVQFVTLRSREMRPVHLDVGRLPPGDLVVEGKQLQSGLYAGGIVATTLGGMALATGIVLGAVGYGSDNAGMITAGVITGGAGVVALSTGISFMLRALPAVSVGQAAPQLAARGVSMAGRF
jgi:hypothetical protein